MVQLQKGQGSANTQRANPHGIRPIGLRAQPALRTGGDISLRDAATNLPGERERGNAGAAVAGAGDADGDGYDDLLIGAKYYDVAGAAYLVTGLRSDIGY